MILYPKIRYWSENQPPVKFIFISGRYVCRCGNVIAVGPKIENVEDDNRFNFPEGYYDANNIILPDELKFDFEIP